MSSSLFPTCPDGSNLKNLSVIKRYKPIKAPQIATVIPKAIHPYVFAFSGSNTKSANKINVACKGERKVIEKNKPRGIPIMIFNAQKQTVLQSGK